MPSTTKIGLAFLLFICLGANAQEEIEGSLEDLLGITSTIAAKRELTARESPGIVSLISRDEIEKSGARDVEEILSLLVPGFAFGVDVEGIVGIGSRGIWGHEGKVLMMMDGVPLNEEVFSTTQFGQHYPAEMVERLEVIRGPGSVIYGGYAMIGVINIISRGSAGKGAVAAFRHSQMSKKPSHSNLTGAVGGQQRDLKYDFTVSGGQGNRSQGEMTDGEGTVVRMDNKNRLEPLVATGGLNWKGLTARGLYDRYHLTHLHFGSTVPADLDPYQESFETRAVALAYKWDVSDRFVLKPRYMYRATYPWRINPGESGQFTKYSTRNLYGLDTDVQFGSSSKWLSGLEYSDLRIRIDESETTSNESPFNYSPNGLSEEFWVVYSEASFQTGVGNFTLGGRYERPKNFKEAFVPRLALTKAWDQFHFKTMASQSYRAPAGIHPDRRQSPNTPLKPEVATNLEVETGYKFNDKLYVVANVFDTRIEDPVVYMSGTGGVGGYNNEGRLGTTGLETELKYKSGKFEASGNVAYYQRTHAAENINGVPGHGTSYLGFANWRANLLTGYHFTKNLGLFPSAQYFGQRYGFVGSGSAGASAYSLERSPEVTLWNVNLRYANLFFDGLTLSAGVMNVTDEKFKLYQTYDGNYPALPFLSRAVNAMVSYQLNY